MNKKSKGEMQKATLLTSLPRDSEHTDFGEPLLQKEEVELTLQCFLPGSAVKALTLNQGLSLSRGSHGHGPQDWML